MNPDQLVRVPVNSITVHRDERQRRELETAGLEESIRRIGLIHPIVVRQDGEEIILVAGERRLQAYKNIGLAEIPTRFTHQLTPVQAQIIELEENVKRSCLTWQEMVRSAAKIHSLYRETDKEWTQAETAFAMSVNFTLISKYIRLNKELDDPRISSCGTMQEALNIILRKEQRNRGETLDEIIGHDPPKLPAEPTTITPLHPIVPTPPPPLPDDILNVSFLDWAPKYKGTKFNLIHCDFPFGIEFAAGPQGLGAEHTAYQDDTNLYQQLLECFADNFDRFASSSCHILFWYSIKTLPETLKCFSKLGIEWQQHPLIWVHTDNAGISPDASRRPRHVYDTCLMGSRGDRHILKVMADAYGSPTDHRLHPSTKPEPMLRHFFTMFVDEYSTVFDPTCGSGSALRAADSLGAKQVLGLEKDSNYFESARQALRSARALKVMSA